MDRVRAALGRHYRRIVEEVPRRRAWEALPSESVLRAFHEAQERAQRGGAERSFATLLIEHLDALVGLAPPPLPPPGPQEGDGVDAAGRLHRPDHGHAARERARRERELRAEEAYVAVYEAAVAAGAEDEEAHRRALAARAEALASDGGPGG